MMLAEIALPTAAEVQAWPWRVAIVVAGFVAAAVCVRLTNFVLRRVYWRRVLAGQPPERIEQLRRSQRQQTVLTLVQSLIKYGVFGAATVFAMGMLAERAASAVFGASLLVVLVGFGMQRVIADAVAGALLVFEGHYSVGDYIVVHQLNIEGVVEQFTLRSTVLRTINGDRAAVMNGAIAACTRMASASRDLRIELVVRGSGAQVEQRLDAVLDEARSSPNRRFLVGPEVASIEPVERVGVPCVRVEIRSVVPPTQEWLVRDRLVERLTDELGSDVIGGVDVFDVAEHAVQALQGASLVGGV